LEPFHPSDAIPLALIPYPRSVAQMGGGIWSADLDGWEPLRGISQAKETTNADSLAWVLARP
jgi:hypothetical protein